MNTDAKKILKIGSLTILALFIIVYAFFRSTNIIFGVKIKNLTLNNAPLVSGINTTENPAKIAGNAKNAINLSLNGREISVDQGGNFSETITLLSGYNIVSLTARDKFGNVDEKDYKLMYSAPAK